MYFVYILQSRKDRGYYIGYTSDLDKRIKEHNAGRTRSLKHRLPMELIYTEEFKRKADAKAREQQLKSWKGGEPFQALIGGSRAPLPAGQKAFGGGSPRLRRD
ncbi:MAG: GIY-YIG nuclease family protein [Fidelibacterota bacterium]|nr:MAG: GIY-YIG nuclease family protein [Candidatus Neomarinimicrobiota bacterium]